MANDIDNAQALVVSNSKFGEIAKAPPNVDLKAQLQIETERRAIIKEFIRDHLIEGVDYGGIHISKNCDNKYQCRNKNHFSKPMLFKPGQEKFTSLFHFIADYKPDYETKEMFGNPDGLVCYSCTLYDFQGKFISRGKGAASLSEGYDYNKCIKMAKKRAKLDAISESGILADFFSIDAQNPTIQANSYPKQAETGQKQAAIDGCTCGTTSQYHGRNCPKFQSPQPNYTDDPNPVTDAEIVDVDDIPL